MFGRSRFIMAIAAAASLAMAACSHTPGPVGPGPGQPGNPPDSQQASLLDERALFSAEAAYNVAATAYVSAESRNLLPPALAAQAQPLLAKAYVALRGARVAYAASDALNFAAFAREATALATQARVLINPG